MTEDPPGLEVRRARRKCRRATGVPGRAGTDVRQEDAATGFRSPAAGLPVARSGTARKMRLDRSIEDGWTSTRSSWRTRAVLVENPSTRSFIVAQDSPTRGQRRRLEKGSRARPRHRSQLSEACDRCCRTGGGRRQGQRPPRGLRCSRDPRRIMVGAPWDSEARFLFVPAVAGRSPLSVECAWEV